MIRESQGYFFVLGKRKSPRARTIGRGGKWRHGRTADQHAGTVCRRHQLNRAKGSREKLPCGWKNYNGETRKAARKKRLFTESWGKSSLEARLRTRRVTGRGASLPAPLLSTFGILVARGTVGALPQTPQGTLSLDPARGRRKGTKSPLDPFSRLSWSRSHAPSACSFLVLRLSPCLLPPNFP